MVTKTLREKRPAPPDGHRTQNEEHPREKRKVEEMGADRQTPDESRDERKATCADAAFIEALLVKVLEMFTPDTPVTMTFRKAHFASGHDLKDFAGKIEIELQPGDVEQ